MAIYAISDLHGHYYEFMKMLELIEFSDEDTMYIIGDVIDRGPNCMELIYHIKDNKNIIHIMGNHEDMMLKYETECRQWYKNGGFEFHEEINYYGESVDELNKSFKDLPISVTIEVNGNTFHLAHASLLIKDGEILKEQNRNHLLWSRNYHLQSYKLNKNNYAVFGHTSTYQIHTEILRRNSSITTNDIAKVESAFFIDGHIYSEINGQLNCLRLDDFKEFIIKKE